MRSSLALVLFALVFAPYPLFACGGDARLVETSRCSFQVAPRLDLAAIEQTVRRKAGACAFAEEDVRDIAALLAQGLRVMPFSAEAFGRLQVIQKQNERCGPAPLVRQGRWIGYLEPNPRWMDGRCTRLRC